MIVRVIPMKLGYAQILSKSGLSSVQEHVFTTLATSFIIIGDLDIRFWYLNCVQGGILGLVVDLDPYKRYFFAGLAGIFLYTSLCSIFPVINDILNECRQHMSVEGQDLSEEDSKVSSIID